jgi:hypothetical protein
MDPCPREFEFAQAQVGVDPEWAAIRDPVILTIITDQCLTCQNPFVLRDSKTCPTTMRINSFEDTLASPAPKLCTCHLLDLLVDVYAQHPVQAISML